MRNILKKRCSRTKMYRIHERLLREGLLLKLQVMQLLYKLTLLQVFLKSHHSFNWLLLWKLSVWNNFLATILVTVISVKYIRISKISFVNTIFYNQSMVRVLLLHPSLYTSRGVRVWVLSSEYKLTKLISFKDETPTAYFWIHMDLKEVECWRNDNLEVRKKKSEA